MAFSGQGLDDIDKADEGQRRSVRRYRTSTGAPRHSNTPSIPSMNSLLSSQHLQSCPPHSLQLKRAFGSRTEWHSASGCLLQIEISPCQKEVHFPPRFWIGVFLTQWCVLPGAVVQSIDACTAAGREGPTPQLRLPCADLINDAFHSSAVIMPWGGLIAPDVYPHWRLCVSLPPN